MTTTEDAIYEFENRENNTNAILYKKRLGEHCPQPSKPSHEDDFIFWDSYTEEAKETVNNELELDVIYQLEKEQKQKQTTAIFQTKFYIRPGQECPICLEPIFTKSTAFLTPCGHGFHKKCIHQGFQTMWLTKQAGIRCPLCRHYHVGDYNLDKYCIWSRKVNEIDKLENFWFSKDLQLGYPCVIDNHYLGMKKNCHYCRKYQKTGK